MAEDKDYDSNDEEDENLLEDADYSKKSDFNKASVVQSAVEKVKETRAKEMKAGYFNVIYRPDGSVKRLYIDDTRKAYMGAVEYLKNVLSHEIATEKTRMAKSIATFELKKKDLFNKYAIQVHEVQGNKVMMLEERYIPNIDEYIPVQIVMNTIGGSSKVSLDNVKGKYNWKVNRYWDEMLEVYDYLFSELNILIALKEYFKQKPSY